MRNIIVIGASAGGIAAIKQMISGFPAGIDAAVVIVVHLSPKSDSNVIARTFQRCTVLECKVASDLMPLERGCVYIAPADYQLMVKGESLKTNRGPHENKYRPSIDVLFRSVAVAFGHRAIGIILTGLLEDGTSGMSAIKRSGGICVVQDPTAADFPDMPQSVLNNIPVDHTGTLEEIPGIIRNIMARPLPPHTIIPNELQIEAEITDNMMNNIDQLKTIGDRSDFICPDCGGGLWALKNDPLHRLRCHTGHVYTEKLFISLQEEKIEESIWVAIRLLEEKANLMQLMHGRQGDAGVKRSEVYQARVDEINKHVHRLKNFLSSLREDMDKTGADTE